MSALMPGPKCTVGVMLDEVSDNDAAAMKTALADPNTKAVDLSTILRAHGYRIMPHTIRRHRRDLCSCSARDGGSDFSQAVSIEGALALLNNGVRA